MRLHVPLSAILFLTPLVSGLGYAFLYSVGLVGGLSKGFTLEHWASVLGSGALWESLMLSLLLPAVILLISGSLALWLCIQYSQRLERGWMGYLLYLPLAMPAVVAAFFSFQWLSGAGMLSRIMYVLGWINGPGSFPEMINDSLYIGVVVTEVMLVFPFFLLLFLRYRRSERVAELHLLAATLGAGRRQSVWRVELPLMLYKVRPALILWWVVLSGAFEIPLLLGRQSPQMISVLIHGKLNKFDLLALPQAYAMAVMYALFVVLFVALEKKIS